MKVLIVAGLSLALLSNELMAKDAEVITVAPQNVDGINVCIKTEGRWGICTEHATVPWDVVTSYMSTTKQRSFDDENLYMFYLGWKKGKGG